MSKISAYPSSAWIVTLLTFDRANQQDKYAVLACRSHISYRAMEMLTMGLPFVHTPAERGPLWASLKPPISFAQIEMSKATSVKTLFVGGPTKLYYCD